MKSSKLIQLLFLVLCVFGCEQPGLVSQNKELKEQLEKIQAKKRSDQRLGQYTLNMIAVAERSLPKDKRLSDAHKQILANTIVKVVNDVFNKKEQKHAFIAILAIESRFQKFAQSPTGPKGLAQVSKTAFKDAMKYCGIGNYTASDVWNEELNLYAGACYFRHQLQLSNNDIFEALISYNQGPYSTSAKNYARNGTLDKIEPLKYIAKFTYLKQKMTDMKSVKRHVVNDLVKK